MLPVPAFTVISGGKHAGNNLAIQVYILLQFIILDILIIVSVILLLLLHIIPKPLPPLL